jgi:hypothetical protein
MDAVNLLVADKSPPRATKTGMTCITAESMTAPTSSVHNEDPSAVDWGRKRDARLTHVDSDIKGR